MMSELSSVKLKNILEKFVKRPEISNNRGIKVCWTSIWEIDDDSLCSARKSIKIHGIDRISNRRRS
jgi:hypothetical protein